MQVNVRVCLTVAGEWGFFVCCAWDHREAGIFLNQKWLYTKKEIITVIVVEEQVFDKQVLRICGERHNSDALLLLIEFS